MKVIRDAVRAIAGAALLLGVGGFPAAQAADKGSAALNAEASSALTNAEFLVNMAKSRKSLWTTAAGSLAQAQEAAKKNDSGAVIEHATVASEQAMLGMAQSSYPLTGVD